MYQSWVELESVEKECSDKGSASVNFAQKWLIEMSFRGILLTFILHFRACTFYFYLSKNVKNTFTKSYFFIYISICTIA